MHFFEFLNNSIFLASRTSRSIGITTHRMHTTTHSSPDDNYGNGCKFLFYTISQLQGFTTSGVQILLKQRYYEA